MMWRMAGKSVRGASHVRSGLPNQDAIAFLPESGAGLPLVLAVSDGHGSAKSFRSDRGARFAVDAVLKEMSSLLEGAHADSASAVKRMAETHLPLALVHRWMAAVEEDLAKEPFLDDEWAKLVGKEGEAARAKVEARPTLAYGATVLGAVVTRAYIIYLQLGDGDILTVSENGEVEKPMPRDERLMANETTSLCSKSAEREVHIVVRPLAGQSAPPALLMISTDGYANSFRDDAGFQQVASDILGLICETGFDAVGTDMAEWLEEASTAGSGDDITLGLVLREGALDAARKHYAALAAAAPAAAPAVAPSAAPAVPKA